MPRTSLGSAILALLLTICLGSGAAEARRHHHSRGAASPEPTMVPMAPMQDDTAGGAQIIENHRSSRYDSQASDGSGEGRVTAGRADFFVEPEAGVKPVIAALEGARRSIDLVVYLLSDERVISALKRAKDRGATVRVMVEPHPFGGSHGNKKSYAKLQQLGINVRYTPHRFRFTHEKAFVIDHKLACITTANFTRSAFSKNREYGFLDTAPGDVKEVEAAFESDWNDQPYSPPNSRLVISPSNSRAKLLELIRSARRTLWIEDETCSDPEVIRAIADRARAGVQATVQLAEAKDVDGLLAAGITAKKMEKHYLHAKAIVVDDERAYVGSVNLTANSMDHNREVGLILTDPTYVGILTQVVRSDWGE